MSLLPRGCLFSSPPAEHSNEMVGDWWIDDGSGWKMEELLLLVSNEEKETISKMRCGKSGSNKFIMWCHTKNGEFSVRSAFYLELERRSGNLDSLNGDPLKILWKQIWEAKVLERKLNVWHGVRWLITCQRGGSWLIRVEDWPTMPKRQGVGRSRKIWNTWCWNVVKLGLCGDYPLFGLIAWQWGIHLWLRGSMVWWCNVRSRELEWLLMMIIWQIWYTRNWWVFEQRKIEPHVACERDLKLLEELKLVMVWEDVSSPSTDSGFKKWLKQIPAFFKLNTDAALSEGKCELVAITRDEVGDVLLTTGEWLEGDWNLEEAEARAILFGMKIAFDAVLGALK